MTIEPKEIFSVKVSESLTESVTSTIQNYFKELRESSPVGLYQLVMDQIEPALIKTVMRHCRHNQSKAAMLLGLSRGTLRTKLKKHFEEGYY